MYRLVVAPKAREEIAGFLDWLTNYNEKTAEDFRLDLERAVNNQVLQSPERWPYFFLTGSPFSCSSLYSFTSNKLLDCL